MKISKKKTSETVCIVCPVVRTDQTLSLGVLTLYIGSLCVALCQTLYIGFPGDRLRDRGPRVSPGGVKPLAGCVGQGPWQKL